MESSTRPLKVLGVDPGTLATGWGLVESHGRTLRMIATGVIRTKPADELWDRLAQIHQTIAELALQHRPDALSLEQCFVSKNVQSALKLGHTRGAIMVAAVAAGAKVFEYAPTLIKSAVTGTGRAEKHQVAEMIRVMLKLDKAPPSDAADALAAAVCHIHHAQGAAGRMQPGVIAPSLPMVAPKGGGRNALAGMGSGVKVISGERR